MSPEVLYIDLDEVESYKTPEDPRQQENSLGFYEDSGLLGHQGDTVSVQQEVKDVSPEMHTFRLQDHRLTVSVDIDSETGIGWTQISPKQVLLVDTNRHSTE